MRVAFTTLLLGLACNPTPSVAPVTTTTTASATPLPMPTPVVMASASPLASASVVDRAPDIDLRAWLTERKVKPPADVDMINSCRSIKLGGRDAAWCDQGAPTEGTIGGESVFSLQIFSADGLVIKVPMAAGPLDNDFIMPGNTDPDAGQYIVLDARLDPSGNSLTLAEKPGKSCGEVLAKYTQKEFAPHRRVVQKVCSARGTYTLQSGKLVRSTGNP